MTALAGRRILGARGADGRVHAPPFEYDPVTHAPPDPLLQVGPEGSEGGMGRRVGPRGRAESTTMITTPVRLHYEHTASHEESSFLRGLADGRLLAQRCPACGKVYVPPRGACPTDGVPTTDEVELSDQGTVTTFCVVNVPYPGQLVTPPYVAAALLLDGADSPIQHLILGCEPGEVRMGMRVRAFWKPRHQWGTTLENIDHFFPTGEPDAPYETYAHHLQGRHRCT